MAERYHYDILRRFFSQKEAQNYFEVHLDNDRLREAVLKEHLNAGELGQAKKLALDRCEHYNEKDSGLVYQWNDFADGLIDDIGKGKRQYDFPELTSLLIKESRWEQLIIQVEKMPYLSSIESVEKYLSGKYSGRLAKLYARTIKEEMKHQVGRKHYQHACRYIRRIKKLGEFDISEELIQELRDLYPMRRALMEELERV